MSNITFGQLPNQPSITGTTIIPTVSANTNYTVTVSNLQAYITANSSGSYSNANVVSLLANFGSNTISTTGNVTTGNLNLTTGYIIAGDFSNNVQSSRNYFQTTGTGSSGFTTLLVVPNPTNTNNSAGGFSVAANSDPTNTAIGTLRAYANNSVQLISGINGNTANVLPLTLSTGRSLLTLGNTVSQVSVTGNILTSGNITATGNIAGTYILGNGSQLTGISAGTNYSNANVVSLLANFGSNTISTTGNIAGSYLLGNGYYLTGISGNTGNGSQISYGNNYANTNVNFSGSSGVQINSGNVVQINSGNIIQLSAGNSVQLHGPTANVRNPPLGNIQISSSIEIVGNSSLVAENGSDLYLSNYGTAYIESDFGLAVQGPVIVTATPYGPSISTTGYISVAGNIMAQANISGNYILGNGYYLTGISANNISGNVTIGNLTVTGTTILNTYVENTAASVNTGSSFTPVWTSGPVQPITATANFTLNAPTGMLPGSSITLIITQDATGNRIMTPNGAYRFAYGSKTLSTSANAIDMMSIFYSGTNYLCNLVKGYV